MRTIEDIYRTLSEEFAERSGTQLVSGGDMSLRLWAVAGEIYTLEAQARFVTRQCFPQTAIGEYLDMHAQIRGLARGEAKKAVGKLRFYLDEARRTDTRVAAGVRCMSADESQVVSTAAGVIPAGALWCDVRAEAVEAGARGNAAAGEICYMLLPPAGISGVKNTAAFTGGCDAEDDEALRGRVVGSYRTLPNGANAAYYETRVMQCAGVAAVTVQPKRRGLGTVDICFSTEAGVPSAAELAAVPAPEPVRVNVSAGVTVKDGRSFEDVRPHVQEAVRGCFGGRMLGRGVYRARLLSAIMGVDGVENCALTAPAADVAAGATQLPELGALEIRQAV